MLQNPVTILSLQREWDGVERMLDRMRRVVISNFGFGSSIAGITLSPIVYNLPLLLAVEVLGQTLAAVRDEGKFSCRSSFVGNLMDASKTSIAWIDWDALRAIIRRRNEIAHDGKFFDSKSCISDIASIRSQLVAWNVIPALPPQIAS